MEARLNSTGFECYHKRYSDIFRKEESQDTIVPDRLPDIASELMAGGNVMIRSKDVSAGRIRLEVNVPAKLSYYSESGELCCLEVGIPFFISAEDPSIPEGGSCIVDLKLADIRAKALNPRKITATAVLDLRLDCYLKETDAFSTVLEEAPCFIHAQVKRTEISYICDVKEKTFILTDELILPEGKGPVVELIEQGVSLELTELKFSGKKALIKGLARSALFFRSEGTATDAAEFTTEFSQIIDLEEENEGAVGTVCLLSSGVYYDVAPGFDGRTVKMELHAVAQLCAEKKRTVDCMTDAYSNCYPLTLEREHRTVTWSGTDMMLRGTATARFDLPRSMTEIITCRGQIVGLIAQEKEARITVLFRIYCRDEQGRVAVLQRSCDRCLSAEKEEGTGLELCGAEVSSVSSALNGNGAEVSAAVSVSVRAVQSEDLSIIRGITYDEARPLDLTAEPSVVIMKMKSTDDLWQAAKENRSSVQAILQANHITECTEPWEKLILIPRSI